MKCVLGAISFDRHGWPAVKSSADVDDKQNWAKASDATYIKYASSEEALNPERSPNPKAFILR